MKLYFQGPMWIYDENGELVNNNIASEHINSHRLLKH